MSVKRRLGSHRHNSESTSQRLFKAVRCSGREMNMDFGDFCIHSSVQRDIQLFSGHSVLVLYDHSVHRQSVRCNLQSMIIFPSIFEHEENAEHVGDMSMSHSFDYPSQRAQQCLANLCVSKVAIMTSILIQFITNHRFTLYQAASDSWRHRECDCTDHLHHTSTSLQRNST